MGGHSPPFHRRRRGAWGQPGFAWKGIARWGRRGAIIFETQHQGFSISGMATTRSILQVELRAYRPAPYILLWLGPCQASGTRRRGISRVPDTSRGISSRHLRTQLSIINVRVTIRSIHTEAKAVIVDIIRAAIPALESDLATHFREQ
jgi:hypothetical protein